jgi:hypothetical protein
VKKKSEREMLMDKSIGMCRQDENTERGLGEMECEIFR